ncbi:hypothetical protein [Bacillus pseudomycoides]|uniref:hypothetical protein n=1 Tax=Bacillus pseudomycoides TaxID=64104 RepID=UPI000BEC7270|nr:hypothetical protein [Bacillus pseudomycoides]PEB42244.1 hypothetical protein COO06_08000 [Bacillus pseudomycoides]PGA62203.1 hypothetical protein COL84_13600 [Bacillus pseudomycoides]
MKENKWSLHVYTNPGIIGWDLGGHICFFNGDSEGDTYVPYITSPHVNVLNQNEASRAYARLTSLLRLINGMRTLQNESTIGASTTLYFNMRHEDYSENIDTLVEELANPFDESILSKIPKWTKDSKRITEDESRPKRSYIYQDYLQLIIDEPLVREVVLLLTLSEEQVIYLLVNTYKIFENIRSDLGLPSKLKKNEFNLPEDLFDALKKMNDHYLYINSREASGIFCRHGEKYPAPKKDKSPLEDIRSDTILAINAWLKYKCLKTFGREYPLKRVENVDKYDEFSISELQF